MWDTAVADLIMYFKIKNLRFWSAGAEELAAMNKKQTNNNKKLGRAWWYASVVPALWEALWEAEARGSL